MLSALVAIHGDTFKLTTCVGKPELAATSLNVNIYYLCTDRNASDACSLLATHLLNVWKQLRVCACACMCMLVFTGFKCYFFCQKVCLVEKKQKKVGQEPMALLLCSDWARRQTSKNFSGNKNGSSKEKQESWKPLTQLGDLIKNLYIRCSHDTFVFLEKKKRF